MYKYNSLSITQSIILDKEVHYMIKLSELFEEYMLELQARGVAKSTYTNYKRYIGRFIQMTGDKDIEKVVNRDVKLYIKQMQADNFKSKTINLALTSIKSMFNYAVEEDYVGLNPIHQKKVNQNDLKSIDIFTDEELIKLCKYNKSSKLYTKFRDHCIILTFIDSGIRANELVNIKLADIHEDYIDIKVTKTKKYRRINISHTLKKALLKLERLRKSYFEEVDKEPQDYLFVSRTGGQLPRQNINDIIIKACEKCNISRHKAYPHNLRHSFACNIMKTSDNNIYLTSKLLGHTNIQTTQIYLRGLRDDEVLEQSKVLSLADLYSRKK